MKRILIVQILFTFMNINAQIDSVKEALEYYPLHIGDYWQYEVTSNILSDFKNWIGYKEVLGDTLMPNNKKYFIIKENGISAHQSSSLQRHLRIDSVISYLYEYTDGVETIIDSLSIKKGDVFGQYRCDDETIQEYFGQYANTKSMRSVIFNDGYGGWEYAYGFGEVRRYFQGGAGSYSYNCDLIYAFIDGIVYGIKTDIRRADELPSNIMLFQNYPNPFNPTTNIKYYIPQRGLVTLKIYDILGKEVAVLVNEDKQSGIHQIEYDAGKLSSGVYFYKLQNGLTVLNKKMILIK